MLNFSNLRVAVLCSKRAPGLRDVLHHPQHGKMFELACVITTESGLADEAEIEAAGVPVLIHPIRRFADDRGASLRDMQLRREYDTVTATALAQLGVDVVVLLGYLYVVTDALLAAFPDRVYNVHDSDLTLLDERGERRYTGLHSTRDAILAGATETRSTLHLVTSKLDGGPVVQRSKAYPVAPFVHEAVLAGHGDIVRAYAYAQREWMMRDGWGGLVVQALEAVAAEPFLEQAAFA